jgi:DNA-directed RNA polymerase subunit RPC12/RpoP
MIEEKESFSCPRCGNQTEKINKGRAIGTGCPQCGWSVVTTYTHPIDQDVELYEVGIRRMDHPNENQIKIISNLSGINFLQARKKIKEGGSILFQINARQTFSIKAMLVDTGLSPIINPDFKW